MTDTLAVYFLYPGGDPDAVLERVAAAFEDADAWPTAAVRGPRERFGAVELSLSVDGTPMHLAPQAADECGHAKPAVPAVELCVGADEFGTDDPGDRARELLGVVAGIYGATADPPALVYGFDPFHWAGVGDLLPVPVTASGLDAGRLDDVTWLTVFTPPFAATYGEHAIRSAPAWHCERLDDGALALLTVADPTDPNGVDYDDVREHFGLDPHGPGL